MLSTFDKLKVMAGVKLYNFLHEEDGAVDIVAIVVLIGIAVVLAILFKDAIGKVLTKMIKGISENADNTQKTLAPVDLDGGG